MVKVKKRSGKLEVFKKSKIIAGCKKTGATTKQAAQVAADVSKKVAKVTIVPATKLSSMVVTSLRKVNKTAATAFVRFRNKKLKDKKKK